MTTTTTDLNLRKGAGTSNPIITLIPGGSTVTVKGDPWYPVEFDGKSGWVSGKYLTGLPEPETPPSEDYVFDAMEIAKSLLGNWYRYGGNFLEEPLSAKRGDCSGYVGWVSHTMGYQPGENKLYNYSANQMLTNFRKGNWKATKIMAGQEQAMDIVFYGYVKNGEPYASHVVFAVGDGRVIGASGGGVAVTSDAAAKAKNAKVRYDDLHYHTHGIVGIYRPQYP